MSRRYSLRADNDLWSIVDVATQDPAKLDGVVLSCMRSGEARQILKILKNIERLRGFSTKYATSTSRMNRLSRAAKRAARQRIPSYG
jgi:hypothetical protein